MARKSFEDVMAILKEVPGTTEHLNKFSVIMGKEILKRRIELGLTQSEVVKIVERHGKRLTQSSLSKAESGDENIKSETYDKIFQALGELKDIVPKFQDIDGTENKKLIKS